MFSTRSLIAGSAAVASVIVTHAASAQAVIIEVFTEADAATASPSTPFLDTVTVGPDGTAYVALRDTTAADVGAIVAFDGTSFTPVMTTTDYALLGSTNDLAAGNGLGVVGGTIRGVSFFDNNVYDIDISTGAITEVVASSAFDTAAGVAANLTAIFEVLPDGTIYGVESVSDQVYVVSPGNTVSIEINASDFAAALGGTSIGGIGVAGTDIYLGSNSSDELVVWDTVTDSASTVLTEAQIEAVTDDIDGNAGFGDIFFAPDGLVYFYETDSDYLLAFDPSDPVGTLDVIATEADFTAGPSSDTINQLAWFDGQIAFTDGGIGFYTIPEPATVAMLAIGGGLIAARRRRA